MKNLKWLYFANTTLNYCETLSKCSQSYILSSLLKKKQIFWLHFEILTIKFFYRVSKITIYIINDSKIRKLVFNIGHKVWTFPQLEIASKIRFKAPLDRDDLFNFIKRRPAYVFSYEFCELLQTAASAVFFNMILSSVQTSSHASTIDKDHEKNYHVLKTVKNSFFFVYIER